MKYCMVYSVITSLSPAPSESVTIYIYTYGGAPSLYEAF